MQIKGFRGESLRAVWNHRVNPGVEIAEVPVFPGRDVHPESTVYPITPADRLTRGCSPGSGGVQPLCVESGNVRSKERGIGYG